MDANFKVNFMGNFSKKIFLVHIFPPHELQIVIVSSVRGGKCRVNAEYDKLDQLVLQLFVLIACSSTYCLGVQSRHEPREMTSGILVICRTASMPHNRLRASCILISARCVYFHG